MRWRQGKLQHGVGWRLHLERKSIEHYWLEAAFHVWLYQYPFAYRGMDAEYILLSVVTPQASHKVREGRFRGQVLPFMH